MRTNFSHEQSSPFLSLVDSFFLVDTLGFLHRSICWHISSFDSDLLFMNDLYLELYSFYRSWFSFVIPFISFELTIFFHSVALNWHFSSHVCFSKWFLYTLIFFCFLLFLLCFFLKFFLSLVSSHSIAVDVWMCCVSFWRCGVPWPFDMSLWKHLNRFAVSCIVFSCAHSLHVAYTIHSYKIVVLCACIFNRSHPQVDCTRNTSIFPRWMEYIWLYCDRTWCHWIECGKCARFVGATCFSIGKLQLRIAPICSATGIGVVCFGIRW